jgi:putative tryptophan/tyrosine transport system substrate-binding protein
VRRRYFLSLAGTIALPARAQTVPRIGFLQAGDPEPSWSLFKNAMAGIGYVYGRTIKIEYRNADAGSGRLDDYATELVRLKVDVIVAALSPAIAAAKKATTTIPIVFLGGTPEIGVTGSVARPEGNTTGVYSPSTTVAGKGLQLFHEIRPQTKLFGLMLNAADPFHVPLRREAAALAEKIELVPALIKSRDELVRAFETMVTRSVDGVLVQPTLGLDMAAELAFKYHLPAISFRAGICRQGRPHGVRCRPGRPTSHRGRPGGQNPKGNGIQGHPGRAGLAFRTGREPKDGEGAGLRLSADVPRPRRRGD